MQKFLVCLCLLVLEVIAISGLPFSYDVDGIRIRRSPSRAVMVSGYYGRPSLRRSEYEPEGAMTAFVSGETVATNSYLGRYNPLQESEELDLPVDQNVRKGVQQVAPGKPLQAEAPEGLGDDAKPEEAPEVVPTKRIPKRRPQKPQQDEDEEGDDEGSWPFQLGRKGGPSYNAFFPIMFSGYHGAKGRNSDGLYPGSATAIANSFSTGRGGVASSHATAYGDPYATTLYRNGFNFKKKPSTPQKEEY